MRFNKHFGLVVCGLIVWIFKGLLKENVIIKLHIQPMVLLNRFND